MRFAVEIVFSVKRSISTVTPSHCHVICSKLWFTVIGFAAVESLKIGYDEFGSEPVRLAVPC